MNKLKTALIILSALFFTANMFAQDISDVKKKIMQANNRMTKAMMNDDYETIMALYTDDAISMPSYSKMLKGKKAIKDHATEMPMKISSMEFKTDEVMADGDYAYEVGTYDITFTMPSMDKPMNDKGKYLTVWEEQNDGSWKIKIETWNTDSNPMQN